MQYCLLESHCLLDIGCSTGVAFGVQLPMRKAKISTDILIIIDLCVQSNCHHSIQAKYYQFVTSDI